mgnify:CR=1 FL=1
MFLEIRGIKKSFGTGDSHVNVLKGLDLDIEKGEFCVLLGPSGSGKSTLLNIIGGIDAADEGSITIEGERLEDMTEKKLSMYRRKHLGYIFQMYNLIPNLTALENVELALQICKNPMDAKEVLEEVGLGDRLDNFPAQLSGGEQQRVAIARALVNHPVLLLADEPTGNLDPVTAKGIMELLSEINKSGTTVLVVTHNKELVNEMGKRVILIEDGHIEQDEIRGSYDI